MTPAAPASAEPTKKVVAMTRSGSMPIIAAASRSNETARIAFPNRVQRTSARSATIRTTALEMTITPRYETKTPVGPPMWRPL